MQGLSVGPNNGKSWKGRDPCAKTDDMTRSGSIVQRLLTVHLYATCWNEERMLPYFFRHHDVLVS
jgi:hypothetical protein